MLIYNIFIIKLHLNKIISHKENIYPLLQLQPHKNAPMVKKYKKPRPIHTICLT